MKYFPLYFFLSAFPFFLSAQHILNTVDNAYDDSLTPIQIHYTGKGDMVIMYESWGTEKLKVLNLKTKKKKSIRKLSGKNVEMIAFHPTQNIIATHSSTWSKRADDDVTKDRIIDLDKKKVICEFPEPEVMEFSYDGSVLYIANQVEHASENTSTEFSLFDDVDYFSRIAFFDWKKKSITDSIIMSNDYEIEVIQNSKKGKYILIGVLHREGDWDNLKRKKELWIYDLEQRQLIKVYSYSVESKLVKTRFSKEDDVLTIWLTDMEKKTKLVSIELKNKEQSHELILKEDFEFMDLSDDGKVFIGIFPNEEYGDQIGYWETQHNKKTIKSAAALISEFGVHEFKILPDNQTLLVENYDELIFWNIKRNQIQKKLTILNCYGFHFSEIKDDKFCLLGEHENSTYKKPKNILSEVSLPSVEMEINTTPPPASSDEQTIVLQTGHTAPISQLEFTDDERFLITADDNGIIKVWDTQTQLEWISFKSILRNDDGFDFVLGEDCKTYFAVHPNRTEVVLTNGCRNSIQFFNYLNGELLNEIAIEFASNIIAGSADGKYLLYPTSMDKYAVFDWETNEEMLQLKTDYSLGNFVFSPDSKQIIYSTRENIIFQNIKTHEIEKKIQHSLSQVKSLAINRNLDYISAVDFDGKLMLFDIEKYTHEVLSKGAIKGGFFILNNIDDLVFDTNRSILYSVGSVNKETNRFSIRAWDMENSGDYSDFSQVASSYMKRFSPINSIALNKAGTIGVSGNDEGVLQWWDMENQKELFPLKPKSGKFLNMSLLPNSGKIVTQELYDTVGIYRLWNLPQLELETVNYQFNFFGEPLQPTFDEKILVGVNYDSISFFTPDDVEIKAEYLLPDTAYYGTHVHLNPDESNVLIWKNFKPIENLKYGKPKQTAILKGYNLKNEKVLFTREVDLGLFKMDDFFSSRFSEKGKYAGVINHDSQIEIFNCQTGKETVLFQLKYKKESFMNFQFIDDRNVISISKNKNNTTNHILFFDREKEIGRIPVSGFEVEDKAQKNLFINRTSHQIAFKVLQKEQVSFATQRKQYIYIFDYQAKKRSSLIPIKKDKLIQFGFLEGQKRLVILYENYFELWQIDGANLLATFVPFGISDYIIYTPDFYYTSTSKSAAGVCFKEEGQLYQLDQMSIKYHRPDIVASRLGYASVEDIQLMKKGYENYLSKMGLTEIELNENWNLPKVSLNNRKAIPSFTNERQITIDIKVKNENKKLDHLYVLVNDVAEVFELNNTQDTSLVIPLVLTDGLNQVEILATNSTGVKSYKEKLAVFYRGLPATPKLFYVGIGNSKYQDEQLDDLAYPSKDAQDLANTLMEESDLKIDTLLLLDEEITKESIESVKDFLSSANENDKIIFFISGHGIRDSKSNDYYFCTNMTTSKNPAENGIRYSIFDELMNQSVCRNKFMILNTCFSGELEQASTYEEQKQFNKSREVYYDYRINSGTNLLSASEGNQTAKEIVGIKIKNGLIAHSIIKALKGKRPFLAKELLQYISYEFEKYKIVLGDNLPVIRLQNTWDGSVLW